MDLFSRLRLKDKISLVIFIQSMLLTIVAVIGFYISNSTYRERTYGQTSYIVNSLAKDVDSKMKRINKLSLDIMVDEDIQKLVESIKVEDTPYQKYIDTSDLRAKLLKYSFSEDYIMSIGVIDLKEDQYIQGSNNSYIDEAQLEKIESNKDKNEGELIWIEPSNDNEQILAVRSIRKTNKLDLTNLGMLVIRIDKNKLVDSGFDYLKDNNYYFSIVSKNSIIIQRGYGVDLKPLNLNIYGDEGHFTKKIDHRDQLISYSSSKFAEWKFIFAIPTENIMFRVSQIVSIIVLIYTCVIIFVIYGGIKFSNRIINPLEKLTSKMKEVNQQWYESPKYKEYLNNIHFINNENRDEISFLESDFKVLVDKINDLVKENYEEKIVMKEWQIKALQAQINPHFLYNTLDSIHWLAKINNQNQIAMMIKSLGNLLRNSIYKSNYVVSIKEEVGILEDYINIQKFRFQERLNVNINIKEEVLNFKIPNLVLQPLVENSISYALEVLVDVCKIEVFSIEENNCIKLVVMDNGPGVNEERLEKLRKMEIEPTSSGIGLKNINDRMKLIFGDKYNLLIDSEEGKWFRVELCILKDNEGDNNVQAFIS
jgi:two-component system sensor histidine kinase YesM